MPTVLITGAGRGIGLEFAKIFAEQHYDLVLTARREDRLRQLADQLHRRHGTGVHVMSADLADPEAPVHLFEETHRLGLSVDALVNNAGYGLAKSFLQADWAEHARFNEVLVSAPLRLTHLYAPAMVERGWGRIVNVASLAGLVPGSPGNTLYGPAKAYLIKFSEALALELRPAGVHVLALCPGFTYSEFHDVSGTRSRVSRLPQYMWMDAQTVARRGFEAVMAGKVVYVSGLVNQTLAGIARLMPTPLALRVMARQAQRAFDTP